MNTGWFKNQFKFRVYMKGELLKRLFRAIALDDQEAIDKLTYLGSASI